MSTIHFYIIWMSLVLKTLVSEWSLRQSVIVPKWLTQREQALSCAVKMLLNILRSIECWNFSIIWHPNWSIQDQVIDYELFLLRHLNYKRLTFRRPLRILTGMWGMAFRVLRVPYSNLMYIFVTVVMCWSLIYWFLENQGIFV